MPLLLRFQTMGNHFLNVLCGTWGLVFYAFLFELALGETLRSLGETFGFLHMDVAIVRLIAGVSGRAAV